MKVQALRLPACKVSMHKNVPLIILEVRFEASTWKIWIGVTLWIVGCACIKLEARRY